jgi:hypothetical protein
VPADPPATNAPASSPSATPVSNAPAANNYIMSDSAPQSTSQPSPEAPEASTPEPTHESPPPHTADPRPRPTQEWSDSEPFWQPEPNDDRGDWQTEGEAAPPKPENTDFPFLDFFRKAEESK